MRIYYLNQTKRTVLFIICVLFSFFSYSSTYYVSNAGSDSNNGLSTTSPWKTLAKVNAVTLLAGDVILFKSGDSWSGQLIPQRSTIAYGAYGTGTKPIISGFQTITGWTNLGNGIYSAPTTASNSLNIVTVNDVLTAKGRYPNTGYLSFESHSGTTSITDNQLTASPNWTGAEVAVRSYAWTLESRKITNHSNSTLAFSALGDEPSNGYGYFFQNDLKTLDLLGEWCIKDGTFYMYFGTQKPTNFIVKASVFDKLVTTYGKAYLTFDGLNFQGANFEIFYLLGSTSSYNKITNCNIEYCLKGICIQGTYATIENNHISDCIVYGIFANGSNDIIRNNTVENIGLFIGVEASGETEFATGINSYGNYSIIEYNTVQNIGYSGIDFRGTNSSVNNNFINTFCTILTDGSGIYTNNNIYTGSVIKDNIITNGLCSLSGTILTDKASVGIYLDEKSAYFTVTGNSISNIDGFGIFLHNARNDDVINNVVYNSSKIQMLLSHNTAAENQSNINITGNIFVSKEASQCAFRFFSFYNDLNFGSASGNIYARPIDDNFTFSVDTYNASEINCTLSGWKTLSGYDANSTKSPIVITNTNQFQYEYNASKTVKTIVLTSQMIDLKGVKYSNSIVLQPYTSVILMKDLSVQTDITLPIVTAFTIPTTATSLSVSISTFTATDNIGVAGYLLTETSATPSSGAVGWSSTKPTTYIFSAIGSKILYAWVKDAAGNVSSSINASVIISSPVATTFSFTGPSTGNANSSSANFTVTPNNLYSGTITITLSGTASTGLTPRVLTFSNYSTAQTFSITPTIAGSIALTPTNNGGLINPANFAYTVKAVIPDAPTSVIATAGNSTASVTFAAPANNGGSAITGYTVTSIPEGGTDANASSTSLTHTISGLVNGTYYVFIVKATNSAGTSVASASSNSVMPFVSAINTFSKRISTGIDDVEESAAGAIYTNSSDIELVYDSYNSQGNQVVGLRFNSIAIPSGATIINAYIQFTTDAPTSLATSLYIYGQKVNNAEIFTLTNKNVSNRLKTTSSVSWIPASWLAIEEAGTDQQTPELKSIVQEIVHQSGWTPGNSMVFIISGTGARIAKSYEKSPPQAAILSIEYTNTNAGIPEAPTSVVAIGGNATASVTFVAPTNNGGSAITGYAVTSIPAGGNDANAGSTSLNHSITGLTNGTSYTFTVKATNTAGTSVASAASNSVVLRSPIYYTENVIICDGSNYFGWTNTGQYERKLIAASGTDSIVTTNLTVNPIVVPIFADFGSYYQYSTAPDLPGTSTNSIIGSWNPSVIKTDNVGITVYTFTPNSGQCATSTPMTVTVMASIIKTFSKRISIGIDDVEESAAGTVYTNSSDIELVYDSWNSAGNQTVGLRFNNITIPSDAIITKANIQFTADVTTSGNTILSIYGQKVNNAEVFAMINRNVSNRAKTTASVLWAPASWTINEAGTNQQTPDLKNIVQEIVQLSGWVSNNSMVFIITGTGTRTSKSYENYSAQAALVTIEYTAPNLKNALITNNIIATQIVEPVKQGKLTCYPLPFTNMLNILFIPLENEKIEIVEIFNSSGCLIKSFTSMKNFISMTLTDFKPGFYLVRVVSDKNSYLQKVIKM